MYIHVIMNSISVFTQQLQSLKKDVQSPTSEYHTSTPTTSADKVTGGKGKATRVQIEENSDSGDEVSSNARVKPQAAASREPEVAAQQSKNKRRNRKKQSKKTTASSAAASATTNTGTNASTVLIPTLSAKWVQLEATLICVAPTLSLPLSLSNLRYIRFHRILMLLYCIVSGQQHMSLHRPGLA